MENVSALDAEIGSRVNITKPKERERERGEEEGKDERKKKG